MALLVLGAALVMTGGYIGDRAALSTGLRLDLFGETAAATAQQTEADTYRIHYTHPDGAIFARSGFTRLGFQRLDDREGPITIRYHRDQPSVFQPQGLSYAPAGAAVGLFLIGMACVLVAHHRLRRMRTAARRLQTTKPS